MMKYFLSFGLLLTLFMSSSVTAELVFSAPPREQRGEGIKTYGALAERLSAVLGEKVIYQQPKGWPEYSQRLRNDEYDIVFDGPHFTSWRIKHIGHKTVARLPGHLAFYFVTKNDNQRLIDLESLRSASVCAFASPNLTSSVLLDLYRNEVAVPVVVGVRGGMSNIMQSLQEGKCEAAVLRDQYYHRALSDEQKSGLKILYKTRKFPNQGISVSNKFSPAQIDAITAVLQQGDPSLKPITDRFAKKAKQFVPSKEVDYDGISVMLEGVVWGW